MKKSKDFEDIYAKIALNGMPRLLSLLSQEQMQPSFGSFDRNYWQYKQIDFSGSLYQTAALSLALAYTYPFVDNPYYKSKKILRLCEGVLNYLPKIQNGDGSFNHNFPSIYKGIPKKLLFISVSISDDE